MFQPSLLNLIIFYNNFYLIHFKINIELIFIIFQYIIFSFIKFLVGLANPQLKMYVKTYQIKHFQSLSLSGIVGFWYFGERHRFGPLHPPRPRFHYQTRAGRQTS